MTHSSWLNSPRILPSRDRSSRWGSDGWSKPHWRDLSGLVPKSSRPSTDVGPGGDEVANADLGGLQVADAVLALIDGWDAGTVYECGWAQHHGVPVVAFGHDSASEGAKMLVGAGAELHRRLLQRAVPIGVGCHGPESRARSGGPDIQMKSLLLLSGGIDSTAVAAWHGCDGALTIDYGHVSARGEINAAVAVATALRVAHETVIVDASAVGSGILAGRRPWSDSVPPEWWPFRNQLLATIGAAYALGNGYSEVLLGTVAGDGARHADGSQAFFERLDALVVMQEGGIRVRAPARHLTARELLHQSGLSRGRSRLDTLVPQI